MTRCTCGEYGAVPRAQSWKSREDWKDGAGSVVPEVEGRDEAFTTTDACMSAGRCNPNSLEAIATPVGMAHAVKVTDTEVEKRLAAIEYAHGSIAHLAPGVGLAD
jgi:hypothetical protein